MSTFYLGTALAITMAIVGCSSGVSTQNVPNDVSIAEGGLPDLNASTTDDNTSNSTQVPVGLKGVAYTDTQIELFWDKSADASVVNYRVKRDGVLLTTSDALNFYDNTVVAGTTYQYSVESVDNNGLPSEAASLFLTTPEAAPTVNATNAQAILEHVILASNGALFSDLLSEATILSKSSNEVDLLSNGFIELSQENDDDTGATTSLYGCDLGGEYSVVDKYFGAPPPSRKQSMQLTNCSSTMFADDNTLHGDMLLDVVISEPGYDSGYISRSGFDAVSITGKNGDTQVLTGDYRSFDGRKRSWSFSESYQYLPVENSEMNDAVAVPFSYLSPAFEGNTILSGVSMERVRGYNIRVDRPDDFYNYLDFEFTIQSPTTGNKQLNVTTPEWFNSDQEGGCFTTGVLKITAEDGSELIVDADNGVAESVQLTVTNDGISTEQTLPWSASLALLHATPTDVINSAPAVPVYSDCKVGS